MSGCGYHAHVTYECIDGHLYDFDDEFYDPDDTSYPCPQCNTLKYLEYAKDDAESTVSGSSMGDYYTGVDIWENAVERVKLAVPNTYLEHLRVIGKVTAIYPNENDNSGWLEKEFVYE